MQKQHWKTRIFHGLLADNDDIYAYERTLGDEKLVVACNFTNKEVPCDLFDDLCIFVKKDRKISKNIIDLSKTEIEKVNIV